MKILLAITFLLIISSVEARQPAVLPVRGISIEEIEPITPDQAKETGYTFKNNRGTSAIVVPPAQKQAERNSAAWTITFIALTLPLLGLPILFRRKEVESTYPDNMIFLDDRRALNQKALDEAPEEEEEVEKAS